MLEGLIIELSMILKVVLAAFFGLLIGLEREGGRKGAGSRTFSLLCIGSALFTLMSVYGFPGSKAPERLAAQIVSGVGFIGAGVIWRERGELLHGITTAAGIWIAAAVGMALALDFYLIALVTTVLTMMIFAKGHPVKKAKKNISKLFQHS